MMVGRTCQVARAVPWHPIIIGLLSKKGHFVCITKPGVILVYSHDYELSHVQIYIYINIHIYIYIMSKIKTILLVRLVVHTGFIMVSYYLTHAYIISMYIYIQYITHMEAS
jgi:hypothetical protein